MTDKSGNPHRPGDLNGLRPRFTLSFTSAGRWWSKNEEIDIVALDEETGTVYFGECKWSTRSVGDDIYRELQRKKTGVAGDRDFRKEKYMLFSKSGFTNA